MDEPLNTIRIEMNGRWTAHELGELLVSLSDLYNMRALMSKQESNSEKFVLDLLRQLSLQKALQKADEQQKVPLRSIIAPYAWGGGIPLESRELARVCQNVLPEGTLRVRRVVYSSPGSADLAGIGDSIGHIKDIIFRIIDWKLNREKLTLENQKLVIENELAQAELARIRIENAQKLVDIAKDCGFSEAERRLMISFADGRQEVIVRSIEEDRLRAVLLLEG